MRRTRGFILLGALASCSAPAVAERLASLPLDAAAQGYVILPSPPRLIRGKNSFDCGPEALAALLNHCGVPATPEDLAARLRTAEQGGTRTRDLVRVTREHDVEVRLVDGSLGGLREAISRGAAPLVLLRVDETAYHFLIVVGLNDAKRKIVAADYDGGLTLIDIDAFIDRWSRADRFMMEIAPPSAASYAGRGARLENEGRPREARAAYERALEIDPKCVDAIVGMGNVAYASGNRGDAASWWHRALAVQDDPRALNNLASVAAEEGGDLPEAERMAERAVELFHVRLEEFSREVKTSEGEAQREAYRDAREAERNLASAFGTLGQIRFALGKHDLAIAAWEASLERLPLDAADRRAGRLFEIGNAYKALGSIARARERWEKAAGIARDAGLKRKIAEALEGK